MLLAWGCPTSGGGVLAVNWGGMLLSGLFRSGMRRIWALRQCASEAGFPGKRWLVAGLGNHGMPGTRHSVGMAVLEQIARRLGVAESWARDSRCAADLALAPFGDAQLVLLRPRRLMNVNGRSVAQAAELFGLTAEDIYLVHDELDKPLGKLALKLGGSARGHNGVRSCISSLNSSNPGGRKMDSLKWFSELLLHTTARAHSDMKSATSKRSKPAERGTLPTGHAGWLKSSRSEHCDPPPTPSFSFLTCAAAGTKGPPTTRLGEAWHDCGAVFITADKASLAGAGWDVPRTVLQAKLPPFQTCWQRSF